MAAIGDQNTSFTSAERGHPDFTIKIESQEWEVHSDLISSKSKFFDKICNGNFRESDEGSVTLHNHCPWTVVRMLHWFYFNTIPDVSFISGIRDIEISLHNVEHLRHQITDVSAYLSLKEIATERSMFQNCFLLYRLADEYIIHELSDHCIHFLKQQLSRDSSSRVEIFHLLHSEKLFEDKKLCTELLQTVLCLYWDPINLVAELKQICEGDGEFMDLVYEMSLKTLGEIMKDREDRMEVISECTDVLDLLRCCCMSNADIAYRMLRVMDAVNGQHETWEFYPKFRVVEEVVDP